MKTLLKLLAGLVVLVILAAGGVFAYAKWKLGQTLARTPDVHVVEFPVPFPLGEARVDELRAEHAGPDDAEGADPLADVDLDALALEEAKARGKHLVEARYVCLECHGKNFGGGVMVDSGAMGRFLGPNLTAGKGSRVKDYTVADWDRIVRHGIRKDGHPGIMPAEDFQAMTDRELSDIIAYIRAVEPVDNEVPAVSYGPVGTMLVAFGALPLAVDIVPDNHAAHEALPPEAAPTPEFGEHLAGVCVGCHRTDLAGGRILAGDPSWPPAMNLTPHAQGLEGWTFAEFETAMREGERRDGSPLRHPMALITPYAKRMTDTEMHALFAFVQSLPPKPTHTD